MQPMFEADGYELLQGALPLVLCDFLSRHFRQLAEAGRLDQDCQVPDADSGHGLPAGEILLESLEPLVQRRTGLDLVPTCSYTRVYRPGAELVRHTDRESCEVSATVTVDAHAAAPWPLWLERPDGQAVAIPMQPGDAVVYLGRERPHWREPFEGEWHVQVFLHYVRADGPFAHHGFDGRSDLNPYFGASGQPR
jgi:hypothetical protein